VHYLWKNINIYDGESDFIVDSREMGYWQGFQPKKFCWIQKAGIFVPAN
jgi:hypothetical protein